MGLSASLPAQNGFGVPMSPAQQARYPNIQFSQFAGAEMIAEKYGLTKDQIDEYAYNSHQKAIAATQAGAFKGEITSIKIKDAEGAESEHTVDEGIRFDAALEAIRGVKLLREGGRITAASSSQNLRRRVGGDGGVGKGPEGARRRAARAHPSRVGDRRRSGGDAGDPTAGGRCARCRRPA